MKLYFYSSTTNGIRFSSHSPHHPLNAGLSCPVRMLWALRKEEDIYLVSKENINKLRREHDFMIIIFLFFLWRNFRLSSLITPLLSSRRAACCQAEDMCMLVCSPAIRSAGMWIQRRLVEEMLEEVVNVEEKFFSLNSRWQNINVGVSSANSPLRSSLSQDSVKTFSPFVCLIWLHSLEED